MTVREGSVDVRSHRLYPSACGHSYVYGVACDGFGIEERDRWEDDVTWGEDGTPPSVLSLFWPKERWTPRGYVRFGVVTTCLPLQRLTKHQTIKGFVEKVLSGTDVTLRPPLVESAISVPGWRPGCFRFFVVRALP